MEILKGFVFDIQRFTNAAWPADGFYKLTGAEPAADGEADATSGAEEGASYLKVATANNAVAFSIVGPADNGDKLEDLESPTDEDLVALSLDCSGFTTATSFTLGDGIGNATLTKVKDGVTVNDLNTGDKLGLAGNCSTGVTAGGIVYKNSGTEPVSEAVTYTGLGAILKADENISATLNNDDSITSGDEVIAVESGSCVVSNGVISDIENDTTVTVGTVVYEYKDGVVTSYVTGNADDITTYAEGTGALTIRPNGTTGSGNSDGEAGEVYYGDAKATISDDGGDSVAATSIVVSEAALKDFTKPTFYVTETSAGWGEYDSSKKNDIVASAAYNAKAEVYTVQVTAETELPVVVDNVSAIIKETKGKSITVDVNGDTDGGAFTLAAKGQVTITNYDDGDAPVITVNSQSITFGDAETDKTALAIGLKTGVVEIESDTAVVSSTGAITKLESGDTVTAAGGEDAEIEVSLNGVAYTLVTKSDDELTNSVLTMVGKKTAQLTDGYAKLDKTHSELQLADNADDDDVFATYTGSGNVIVESDGALSNVGNGDSVAIAVKDGTTTTTITWTASGSALEKQSTAADVLPDYWTIDGDSVSISADGIPAADDVTNGVLLHEDGGNDTDDFDAFKFNGKKFDGAAVAVAQHIVDGVYVDKDGNTSLSSTGAVGKFSVTDEVVTYESTNAAGNQTIVIDDLGDYAWSVKGGSGKDLIMTAPESDESAGDAGSVTSASISGGDGDDVISIVDEGEGYISGGAGKDEITFTGAREGTVEGGAGDDRIAVGGTGDHYVDGGDGNDVLVNEGDDSSPGTVSLIGGKGNDTITAFSGDDYVEGGDGKDVFMGLESSMTINDYSLADDVIVAAEDNIGVNVDSFDVDGEFVVSTGNDTNTIDISASMSDSTYYAVKLTNEKGKKSQIVAWAKEDSSDVDGSTAKDNLVLIGSDNSEGDALKGGSGKDTIYAGSDDTVIAGKGNDSISIASEHDGAVYFEFSKSSGNDTVSGFKESFDGGDQLWMQEGTASDLSLSIETKNNDTHVLAKLGSSKVTVQGSGANNDTGAIELLVNDAKVALAGNAETIKASAADYADFYFGNKSALSFADTDDDLNIDLRDTTHFRKISVLEGGKGVNTLIGSTGKDTIISGGGETSLWGGKGNDSLVGVDDAVDVFFFTTGDGKDTISGFTVYAEDVADTADIFNTNGAKISEAKLIEDKGLQIGYNSADKAIIDSFTSENDILQYSEDNLKTIKYAKVGKASGTNDFDYDAVVTAYVGGNKHDKVVVSGEAEVWLDGSKGVAYSSVEEIDATTSNDSVILVGDNASNTITGGANDSALWGGTGSSNDVLNGTAGTTVYWYGYGEGNDVITAASNSSAEDIVNLYNITGDMLAAADILDTKVVLTTTAGQTLTVNTNHDVTFTLTDGTAFVANMSTHEWEQA